MKVKVPDGMFIAAHEAHGRYNGGMDGGLTTAILEAALRWLAENPIVPTFAQSEQLMDKFISSNREGVQSLDTEELVAEWQRRMFLAPEPDAVKDDELCGILTELAETVLFVDRRYRMLRRIEAYRRGSNAETTKK